MEEEEPTHFNFSSIVCEVQNGLRKKIVLRSLAELQYLTGEDGPTDNSKALDILDAFKIHASEIGLAATIYLGKTQSLESYMIAARAAIRWRRLRELMRLPSWLKDEILKGHMQTQAGCYLDKLFISMLANHCLYGVKGRHLRNAYHRHRRTSRPSVAFRKAIAACDDDFLKKTEKKNRAEARTHTRAMLKLMPLIKENKSLVARATELEHLLAYSVSELEAALSQVSTEKTKNWALTEELYVYEHHTKRLEKDIEYWALLADEAICKKCEDINSLRETVIQSLREEQFNGIFKVYEFIRDLQGLNACLHLSNIVCLQCEMKTSDGEFTLVRKLRELNSRLIDTFRTLKGGNMRELVVSLKGILEVIKKYDRPPRETVKIVEKIVVKEIVKEVVKTPEIRMNIQVKPVFQKTVTVVNEPALSGQRSGTQYFGEACLYSEKLGDRTTWFGFKANMDLANLMALCKTDIRVLDFSSEPQVPHGLRQIVLCELIRICSVTNSKQAIVCARRFGKEPVSKRPIEIYKDTFVEVLKDKLDDDQLYTGLCGMLAGVLGARNAWQNRFVLSGQILPGKGVEED